MNTPRDRTVPSAPRHLAWTVAAVLGAACAAPAAVQAQSGSSLFAVGESGAKAASRPASSSAAKPDTVKVPVTKAATDKAGSAKTSAAKTTTAKNAAAKTAGAKTTTAGRGGSASQAKRRATDDRKTAAAGRNARAAVPVGPLALVGRWQDASCVPLGAAGASAPLFVQRQYRFDDKGQAWQLDATVFSDANCMPSSRMLTYRGEGSLQMTGRSRVADGAWDANFRIARWQATPASRDGVMALLNARCGSGDFETGRALDLARTGCAPLGIEPLARRASELELVRVVDGKFFLGSRSFLLAERDQRPAQLSRYGMERAAN